MERYLIQSHDGAAAIFAQYGGIWGHKIGLDTLRFSHVADARWYLDNRMISNAQAQRRAMIVVDPA